MTTPVISTIGLAFLIDAEGFQLQPISTPFSFITEKGLTPSLIIQNGATANIIAIGQPAVIGLKIFEDTDIAVNTVHPITCYVGSSGSRTVLQPSTLPLVTPTTNTKVYRLLAGNFIVLYVLPSAAIAANAAILSIGLFKPITLDSVISHSGTSIGTVIHESGSTGTAILTSAASNLTYNFNGLVIMNNSVVSNTVIDYMAVLTGFTGSITANVYQVSSTGVPVVGGITYSVTSQPISQPTGGTLVVSIPPAFSGVPFSGSISINFPNLGGVSTLEPLPIPYSPVYSAPASRIDMALMNRINAQQRDTIAELEGKLSTLLSLS